jgi:acyl-CoA hydrolase
MMLRALYLSKLCTPFPALDFDSPIRNGNLVHVDAAAVFASQKSLEVRQNSAE